MKSEKWKMKNELGECHFHEKEEKSSWRYRMPKKLLSDWYIWQNKFPAYAANFFWCNFITCEKKYAQTQIHPG